MIYRYDYGNRNTTTTIEGWVIANNWCDLGIQTPGQMVELGRKEIFDFQYPFYSTSEADRASFEKTFILRFFSRQVALETEAAFKLRLLARLTECMPEFEQLFRSMTIVTDPGSTFHETITTSKNTTGSYDDRSTGTHDVNENRKTTGSSTGHTTVNASNERNTSTNQTGDSTGNSSDSGTTDQSSNTEDQRIESKNPQINFSGKDFASDMSRGKNDTTGKETRSSESEYTAKSESNSNTDETGSSQSTTEQTSGTNNSDTVDRSEKTSSESGRTEKRDDLGKTERIGYNVPQVELSMKYREAIININHMLCDRLEVLFSIWQ